MWAFSFIDESTIFNLKRLKCIFFAREKVNVLMKSKRLLKEINQIFESFDCLHLMLIVWDLATR